MFLYMFFLFSVQGFQLYLVGRIGKRVFIIVVFFQKGKFSLSDFDSEEKLVGKIFCFMFCFFEFDYVSFCCYS